MCWGLRYTAAGQKLWSANLGGESALFIPKEIPSWIGIKCEKWKGKKCIAFAAQYCCPSEESIDEPIEHAVEPFPIFNQIRSVECSPNAKNFDFDSKWNVKAKLNIFKPLNGNYNSLEIPESKAIILHISQIVPQVHT